VIQFLPSRGLVRSPLYLPPVAEVPKGDATAIAFDFTGTGIAATSDTSQIILRDFLLTHFTGSSDAPAGSFYAQFLHQHGQVQRQLFSREMRLELIAGSAKAPFFLRSPYLLGAGDTLTASIANTGNDGAGNFIAANIQLVAWGVYL
jgi:hypothetical protein